MSGFKELKVWQVAIDMVYRIYDVTKSYPQTETFGLVSQMRRCAVSIPSNIAEGSSRNSAKEFIQFLYIAQGSLSELDTQLIISHHLGFLPDIEQFQDTMMRLRSMLSGLIKSLQKQKEIK